MQETIVTIQGVKGQGKAAKSIPLCQSMAKGPPKTQGPGPRAACRADRGRVKSLKK